jgi:hypothetical protein
MLTSDDPQFSNMTLFVPFITIPSLAVETDIHIFNIDSESTITKATSFKISFVSKKPIWGAFSFFWKLKVWKSRHVICCTPFCFCYVAIAIACQLTTTVYQNIIEFRPNSRIFLHDTCEVNEKYKLTTQTNVCSIWIQNNFHMWEQEHRKGGTHTPEFKFIWESIRDSIKKIFWAMLYLYNSYDIIRTPSRIHFYPRCMIHKAFRSVFLPGYLTTIEA